MKSITLALLLISSFFSISVKSAFATKPEPIIETIEVYQTRTIVDSETKEEREAQCNFFNGCVEAGENVTIHLSGIAYNNGLPLPEGSKVKVRLKSEGCNDWPVGGGFQEAPLYDNYVEITAPGLNIKGTCSYQLIVKLEAGESGLTGDDKPETNKTYLATSTIVQAQCSSEQCNEDLTRSSRYELCSQIDESAPEYQSCADCFSNDGIWTAVGCIPSNPNDVIKVIITIGLALGGGVVLVMILAGSFMLSVSQGDPNKTKEAKEIITSAIIGLLFVIFSVTILQFIGVEILHIPGFGE